MTSDRLLLGDFKVLTFDVYGTLIDWESGMVEALKPLSERAARKLSRDEILQAHARAESAQQKQTPSKLYRDLLAIVYKRLAEEWQVEASHDECIAYGRSVGNWPAFADSAEALDYLKDYFKLVILSNVDNESLAHSRQRLGVAFDAVFTAEDVGAYKPADTGFQYMLSNLAASGFEKADILHTAESLFHDHVPASRHGLNSCWIYRRHDQKGFGATLKPDSKPEIQFSFNSMVELVSAHKAEQGRLDN